MPMCQCDKVPSLWSADTPLSICQSPYIMISKAIDKMPICLFSKLSSFKSNCKKWRMGCCFLSNLGPRFFEIRLGLYGKKFQKCLINYLGLSYEQTVMSQLYLLVKHCVFMRSLSIVVTSQIKLSPPPPGLFTLSYRPNLSLLTLVLMAGVAKQW